MGASFYSMKNPNILPVTTGLSNQQLMNRGATRPKMLAVKGGESSLNYGQIPGLRDNVNSASPGMRRAKRKMG